MKELVIKDGDKAFARRIDGTVLCLTFRTIAAKIREMAWIEQNGSPPHPTLLYNCSILPLSWQHTTVPRPVEPRGAALLPKEIQ